MIAIRFLISSLCQQFTSMGACFGVCLEYTSNDEPMHIQRVQMTLQQERYISEDNSMLSSVRTKSLKTAQEDFSAHSSSPTDNTLELGPSTTDIPFVNHGLLQWSEQRKLWVGDRSHVNPKCQRDPTISFASPYESLVGTGHKFAEPVPLSELVSSLAQVWEEEGLFN